MNYYEVRIAGRSYHSKKPLTYCTEASLSAGQIVTVPVRNNELSGFIIKKVSKPSFEVKPIARISNSPTLPDAAIKLHDWMEAYYPAESSATLRLFLPENILKKQREIPSQPQVDFTNNQSQPPLRKDQRGAIKQITGSKSTRFLLHGETGSGKTRVYAELAKRTLEKRSVLVLTPEIGLTTQLSKQFSEIIDIKPIVLHSQLTQKQRRERWEMIANATKPQLIIGTRLALFAPFSSLGLIILDEAHEDAYKQDQSPHYHAVTVAAQLSNIHKSILLLGSATPSAVDYSIFQSKKLPIIQMGLKGHDQKDYSYQIINSSERSLFSTSNYVSQPLIKLVEAAISNGEQSLIYLNRRGTARLVLCQKCGWESICPNCDIALTYHEDGHVMRCHTCGLSSPPPSNCPSCKSADIFYKQLGTKALISHVQKLFPQANVARFDTDVSKNERLEARYDAIRSGEIDILVGTQLLGKGLDLPKLSVVGVLQADSSLLMPDFSAREKTYQQLHQIIGRIGRGHRHGHVVIQTFNPDSTVINAAAKKNYLEFINEELAERKAFLYPPYCFMLKLTISRKVSQNAEMTAEQTAKSIRQLKLPVQIIGPSPAFKHKTHGSYHWQIVVKSKDRSHLLEIIKSLPKNIKHDIDPINLL